MLNMCSYSRYRNEMLYLYYEVSPSQQTGTNNGLIVDMRHIYAYLLQFLAGATEDQLIDFMDLYCTKLRRKVLLLALMYRELAANADAVVLVPQGDMVEEVRALLSANYQVLFLQ